MLLPTDGSTDRLEFSGEREVPVARVTLPGNPLGLGLEKGTVYLQRAIPSAILPARDPAHAA